METNMKCDYFQKNLCRSCSLLDHSYEQSLKLKEQELASLFFHYSPLLLASVGCQEQVGGSRSKMKLAVFDEGDGITFGIVDSSMAMSELEKCPLHAEGLNQLLPILKQLLKKYKIPPYDLNNKKGELKYIILTKSAETDQVMLRLVIRSKESLDRLIKLASEIQSVEKQVRVVTANIQPDHKAILEGDEEIVLSSEKTIIHYFDGYQLALGARSFFQVTPMIAKKLYAAVREDLKKHPAKNLLDLFCGVGAFSFYAQEHATNVTGVELSAEAIECANHSNSLNNTSIEFVAEDAFKYLQKHSSLFDAVIVNPPRRGLGEEIVLLLLKLAAEKIYYSSCNAQTLYRDFEILQDHYEIVSLQIFDMFPFTAHFETLAIFRRKTG